MGSLKHIAGIGAIGVVALVAFLFWRIGELKDEQSAKLQEIDRLEWKLVTVKAERDSIKGLGEYSMPDTVSLIDTLIVIDTVSGETHIVYRDIPVISGDIAFDETQVFGEDSSLSIQVKGVFYYPPAYAYVGTDSCRNWMQIIPDWRKLPVTPLTARSPKRWGIGLACAMSSRGVAFPGISMRYNRTSIAVYRRIDQNVWMVGLGYEILRF